jgi:hypothetical protein
MSDTITETSEIQASETEATQDSDTREARIAEAAEKLVHGLFGVGKLWAAHGLNVGRSALETTATTLRTTAALLGDISQRFEPSEGGTIEGEQTEDRNAA